MLESLILHELIDKLIIDLLVAGVITSFGVPPKNYADQSIRFTSERLEVSERKELVIAPVVGNIKQGVRDQ